MTTCPGCHEEVYADVVDDGERLRCRSCGETDDAAAFSDPLAGPEHRGGYSRGDGPETDA